MIRSIYQIDFVDSAGTATRLLDIGDWIADFIEISFNQEADEFAATLAKWGGGVPKRGSRRPLTWRRLVEHASHTAAHLHCIRRPSEVPTQQTGTLRITTEGTSEVWDLLDAVILSVVCKPDRDGDYATSETYRLTAGKAMPFSGLALYQGIRHEWMQVAHQDITTNHQDL